jgi:hypothetical protein
MKENANGLYAASAPQTSKMLEVSVARRFVLDKSMAKIEFRSLWRHIVLVH